MNYSQTAMQNASLCLSRYLLALIYHAGSGHPGGTLSCIDVLYHLVKNELRWNCNPDYSEDRNRFIMSKGHACPALYAAAIEAGLLPKSSIKELRKLDSNLQGHPHCGCLPWVETSTGSLGQGFSVAVGMAMGLRYKDSPARIYVMLGDGELQEGEIWEGAMCAAHYKLDNLCAVIDYNKIQSDNLNKNIIALEPLGAKWEAFNWHVIEIDGHDFNAIRNAFEDAKSVKKSPTVIIAHTIKGKGVSFMENSPQWHGSVKLKREELIKALEDLKTPQDDIERYLNGKI